MYMCSDICVCLLQVCCAKDINWILYRKVTITHSYFFPWVYHLRQLMKTNGVKEQFYSPRGLNIDLMIASAHWTATSEKLEVEGAYFTFQVNVHVPLLRLIIYNQPHLSLGLGVGQGGWSPSSNHSWKYWLTPANNLRLRWDHWTSFSVEDFHTLKKSERKVGHIL